MTPATTESRDLAAPKPTLLVTDYLVHSDLLGDFTIPSNSAIEFAAGLLGFPECRRFALVRAGTDSMYWLQSLDYPTLVFLLVDPFPHFTDYAVEIPVVDAQELGVAEPSDLAMLSIVTLPPPGSGERPTANLQGPVAINLRSRRGKQIVGGDADLGVRRPFDIAKSA
jgi:flagellar assembly factor FliW